MKHDRDVANVMDIVVVSIVKVHLKLRSSKIALAGCMRFNACSAFWRKIVAIAGMTLTVCP